MIVRYGPKVPKGWLPVFSVGSEREARRLLTLACPVNTQGEFVAEELVKAQTIDNLFAFGDRLKAMHDEHILGTDACACVIESKGG